MDSFTEQSNATASGRSDSSIVGSLRKSSVLGKLKEFEEVSFEIRNANPKYGKHLPPLPLCLASDPEIEHMPPITLNTEDIDCMASDHLANNMQLSTTMDNKLSSSGNCESEIEHMPPITLNTEDIDCTASDHLAKNMQLLTTLDNQLPSGGDCESEIEHMPPITLNTEDIDCMVSDHLANNMQLLTTLDNQLPSGGDCKPEHEHMPPITLNTEDSDCTASDHLANNMQLLTTLDNQLPSGGDCEPGHEHMPPITLNTGDSDCTASDHLANNMQLLTTLDNQLPSVGDCEPEFQIKRPILSEKFRICDKLCSDITTENSECFLEQNSLSTQHVVEETRPQPLASSAIETSDPKVKSAVTEQLDVHVTPVRIQLLDALAEDNNLFPDEVAESTTITSIAVAKSDGNGLEPATNTIHVKSVAAEKPRQGRRRSFLSTLGRRLLKFGRTLCCCCCCK